MEKIFQNGDDFMEFEKLIKERYSVRQFRPEHLPQNVVDKLLQAAHLAPTGCNNQPQRILVLNLYLWTCT